MYAVYSCYDEGGALLYVGIAADVIQRMIAHRNRPAPWFAEMCRFHVRLFRTREEAAAAETETIQLLHPRHNIDRDGRSARGWVRVVGRGRRSGRPRLIAPAPRPPAPLAHPVVFAPRPPDGLLRCAKLSEAQVREIRALPRHRTHTLRAIAHRYGVSHETIRAVLRGRTYRYVQSH